MPIRLNKRVRVVLQARTTSSRLPAKCLLPLGGFPIAVLAAKRISNTGLDTVLATSDEASDNVLIGELERHSVAYCRGSMANVLDRFVKATSDLADDDICVRMTADNVFPDGHFVEQLLDEFISQSASYLSSANDLPYGLAAEIFRVGQLRKAANSVRDDYDVEHVTPAIKRSVSCLRSKMDINLGDNSDLSCTIDSLGDYLRACEIFNSLAKNDNPTKVSFVDLVQRLVCLERKRKQSSADTKIQVIGPPLVFGTVQLGLNYGRLRSGDKPSVDSAVELIRVATKAGVSQFDTASAYGDSEHKIGIAIADHSNSGIVPLTKLSPLNSLDSNAEEGTVRTFVNESVYGSLFNLKIQQLPCLCLHRASQLKDHKGVIWDQLLQLQQRGLIDNLGVSVQSLDELRLAVGETSVKHIQLPFNLLDERWDNFFQTYDKPEGLTIHVRSVFLQGLLLCDDNEYWPDIGSVDSNKIVRAIGALVEEFERRSRHDLCLAFVRSMPWIDGVVVGMDSIEQFECNLNLFSTPLLSEAQIQKIRKTFTNVPEKLLNPAQWN